jgi:hypothetical protein
MNENYELHISLIALHISLEDFTVPDVYHYILLDWLVIKRLLLIYHL